MLEYPSDLARVLDKRVANAITLKLDHGPERAEGLNQGFLRCVDIERVSDINLSLDSLSPNFRPIW